jgi:glycosyltransferase involved in cell wall biosynthesis
MPPDNGLVVLIPIRNDWRALSLLLPRLLRALASETPPLAIVVVDDGSTEPPPQDLGASLLSSNASLRIVHLRRNLGHQRALAVGLCYIQTHVPCRAVVVMDGDGEDPPEEVPALLRRMESTSPASIVFAERRRRADGMLFGAFYWAYRLLHRLLTGRSVRVGNFSAIPLDRLNSLVVVSELWIHYAASAYRSRQPIALVPSHRAPRLDGRSTMTFVDLVAHGLSAMSVFGDMVVTRLVIGAAAFVVAAAVVLAVMLGAPLSTSLVVPTWVTTGAGFLIVIVLQVVLFVALLAVQILGSRNLATVVPIRDFQAFIASTRDVA